MNIEVYQTFNAISTDLRESDTNSLSKIGLSDRKAVFQTAETA